MKMLCMKIKVANNHKLSLQQICLYFCHPISRDNQMQNILEQSHFTPFPNRTVAFAQNWSAKIDNLEDGGGGGGLGLVQLIKIIFVPNILHLIVDELTV